MRGVCVYVVCVCVCMCVFTWCLCVCVHGGMHVEVYIHPNRQLLISLSLSHQCLLKQG